MIKNIKKILSSSLTISAVTECDIKKQIIYDKYGIHILGKAVR